MGGIGSDIAVESAAGILTPVTGALWHNCGSVFVVVNAALLLRLSDQGADYRVGGMKLLTPDAAPWCVESGCFPETGADGAGQLHIVTVTIVLPAVSPGRLRGCSPPVP